MEKVSTINFFSLFDMEENFNLDASKLEKNYLNLQKEFHPDTNKKSNSEEIYRINNAYKILKDPLKRAKYLLEINNHTITEKDRIPEKYLLQIMELEDNLTSIDIQKEIFTLHQKHYSALEKSFESENFQEAKLNFLLLRYIVRLEEKINELN